MTTTLKDLYSREKPVYLFLPDTKSVRAAIAEKRNGYEPLWHLEGQWFVVPTIVYNVTDSHVAFSFAALLHRALFVGRHTNLYPANLRDMSNGGALYGTPAELSKILLPTKVDMLEAVILRTMEHLVAHESRGNEIKRLLVAVTEEHNLIKGKPHGGTESAT